MQINEGTYDARVLSATLTETKNEDPQPVIEVIIEVTGNGLENPVELAKSYYLSDRPDEYNDNKPEWQVSLERLRDIGFKGADISQLGSCVGFVGKAGVKNKTSKRGTAYSAVSWIGRALQAKPMEQAKAKGFAERMKARIQAMEGGRPAAAPAAAQRPAQRAQAPQQRPAQRQQPAPPAPDFNAPDDSEVPF
jgi:hypothetical protein